jgi:hypothetical protein
VAEHRTGLVRSVALLVGLLAVLGACSNDDAAKPAVTLDGSPRVPDVEGVVEKVADDFSSLTLDGDRTYVVSKTKGPQSFSTVDGATQPLRRWVGQYVQLGLGDDDKTVEWVAGIAAVVPTADGKKAVYYSGELRQATGKRLEFADGTVLRLVDGAEPPAKAEGKQVLATIDPDARVVVSLVPR